MGTPTQVLRPSWEAPGESQRGLRARVLNRGRARELLWPLEVLRVGTLTSLSTSGSSLVIGVTRRPLLLLIILHFSFLRIT